MLIVLSITLVMVFLTLTHPMTGGFQGLIEKLPKEHFNWGLFDRPWVVGFFAVTLLINQLVQNNSMTSTGGAKYVFVNFHEPVSEHVKPPQKKRYCYRIPVTISHWF